MSTTAFDWRTRARCRTQDPETFFPDKGKPTASAKRICGGCPVQSRCLQDAIVAGYVHGVWGGLSAHERKALVVAERRRTVAAMASAA